MSVIKRFMVRQAHHERLLISFLHLASCILLLASCFMFLVPSAHAEGRIVTSIEIRGNTTTSTETILATIKTKKGMVFDRETLKKDVLSLWKLGQIQDVQIEKAEKTGGIALTYVLIEKPIITKISFKGNKKLKKDDLDKEVALHTYRPLDEKLLAESILKMREAYAKKGYYLADIDYHLDAGEGNEAEIVFDIYEHKGAVIKRVEFIGNHAFKDKELKKVIRTKEKSAFSWLTSGGGKFKEEQLEPDVVMLSYHYLNDGYIKVKVDNPKVAISKDKRYIFITYTLEEGKQYKLGDIDIAGDILTTKEELRSFLQVKSKTIYSQKTISEDMAKLTDFYGESGYAFVNVVPDIKPNDETLIADLTFNIEKGNRIKIEKINISGNTTTRDKVIRREMQIKEGDVYNLRLVNLSRDKIKQLGYFEEVNFATPRGNRDDTLILNISVKEKPTGTFNIGAGFSTSENFIFSASIAKENFFGYGIGGQISAELSSRRQQFMLNFHDPYFLDSEWMLSSNLFKSIYRFSDFDRESYGGGLSIGHRIFDNSSVSIGYQAENVEATDFSFAVPELFRQNAKGLTSEIIFSMARDTRDNRIFPTKGMYHAVENEFSGSKLGGDNDFYRISGTSRFYYPVKWGIIAKTNAQIGYMQSLGDRSIPLFERYITGGIYSLRGFMPRSIGPRLMIPGSAGGADMEFVYGGNKQILLNGELEFPIYNPAGLKWVFFLDAGNAFAEQENYSLRQLRSDWGLGLRWVSPIGPLRFEWGVPFDRRPGEDSVVFNFTIGSLF